MKQIYSNKENYPSNGLQNVKQEKGLKTQESLAAIPNPFARNINPYLVNKFDKNGITLLYLSVKRGELDKVQYLTGVKELKTNVNLGTKGGKTPLYKAIIESGMAPAVYLEIAECLISKGAKNNYYNGKTPLHLAAMNCLVEVLKAFSSKNHDFRQKTHDPNVISLTFTSQATEDRIKQELKPIFEEQKVFEFKGYKFSQKTDDLTTVVNLIFTSRASEPEIKEGLRVILNQEALGLKEYKFTQKNGNLTVINLMLTSRAEKKEIKEALKTIPAKQLESILKETKIDWSQPDICNKTVLQKFVNAKGLNWPEDITPDAPMSEVTVLGEGD